MAAKDPIEKQARELIRAQGFWCARIERVLAADRDGDREVLFHGRFQGHREMKIPGETEDSLYTLTLRGDETAFVSSGW